MSDNTWLQKHWRPITILTLVFVVLARYFGWTDPDISEQTHSQMMTLIKWGLTSYIGSRGIEKVAEIVTNKKGAG